MKTLGKVSPASDAELTRQLELVGEELALPVARRVVAVEVEAGLADGDRALVGEQLAELVEAVRIFVGSLVRMDAERGPDSWVRVGDRERLAAGLDA